MYLGFARSAGLGYWESLGYTFAGSALWEIAGETTPPSINDQITTGIGGAFLGEALFRMASLMLEHGGVPRFWRELGAAAISPATASTGSPSATASAPSFPATTRRTTAASTSATAARAERGGRPRHQFQRNEAQVDFSLDYGLPGKQDYAYTRPFDYFTFQATASSANGSRT